MLPMSIAFIISLIVTILVIRYDRLHGHLSADHDMVGVQKFHSVAVPRIGGIGVLMGATSASLVLWALQPDENLGQFGLQVLLCSLIAFSAGLAEPF